MNSPPHAQPPHPARGRQPRDPRGLPQDPRRNRRTLERLDEAEAALLGEGTGGPVTKGFALDSAYQGQEALELVQ